VAQRLVRRLCPSCRIVHDDLEAHRLGVAHAIRRVKASAGRGCPQCKHTGYIDRIAVAEVLTPDDAVRTAIAHGATAGEIRTAMRAANCASMRDVALALVEDGVTSIEEVDRVLSSETAAAKTVVNDRRRVLIADDDRIIRMLLKVLLEQDGYTVLETENGQQALDVARRERPDLVIIDLTMPQMDGYEAIQRIRQEAAIASLPVIVLTAETGPGVEQRVLELGADDYLIKPFEADVLRARVRAVFRRQERIAS
jgi:CheY-like chemotaxis protein